MKESKGHILVVEDDLRLRTLVESHLRSYAFSVQGLNDGRQVERVVTESPVDLIVLDLGLPGEDGLQVCQRLRQKHPVPILMLTARGDELDRILGLEMGADDYLAKPFHPRELLARIQAILRRTRGPALPIAAVDEPRKVGPFRVDRKRQEIFLEERLLELSTAEFNTLAAFIDHEGQVLSRERLLRLTRQRLHDPDDRSIDMQISRLRRLLGDDRRENRHIRTVWGRGYLFVAEP
jgi:two-component system phosphate regulon response regulator OmpR